MSLDAYVRERVRNGRMRLVKIDVEGAEPKVLRGLHETLSGRPPDVIMVEVRVEMLFQHGYHAKDVSGPLLECGYASTS